MPGEVGVNPLEAMNKSETAEAMADAMASLGSTFETIIDDIHASVSFYVQHALRDYEMDTYQNITTVAQNGVERAVEVQGAAVTITDADREGAENFREGMESMDIPINF